jgi:translation elongation factor EF-Tu-like GTPase
MKKATVKIDDVFKITGRGVVVKCQIVDGDINQEDSIVFGDSRYAITSVEQFAVVGGNGAPYSVGLILKGAIEDIDQFKAEVRKFIGNEVEIVSPII